MAEVRIPTDKPPARRVWGTPLARSTVLNIVGSVIPPLVGLVTLPYIIRNLGIERFGVLSLVWVALTYFTLFDMGLARASARFTAEALGERRSEDIPAIVWTALVWQVGFGSVGGVLLAFVTPLVVESIIRIPPSLIPETKVMFRILGLSIPVIICSLTLRRVLEAAQRFDLANAVRIPAQIGLFLGPAVAVYFNYDFEGIAVFLLLSQTAAVAGYGAAVAHALPVFRERCRIDFRLSRPLLSYGGWMTVYVMITPVLSYLDRFMIGALISVTAVAFYAVPFEMLMRANYVVPSSLGATLFPTFSSLGHRRRDEVERIYLRGLKYMLISMALLALILTLFAGDILRIWLGPEFAERSTLVFQILALGFFLTGLGWLPITYLQSMGRPDLVSKLLLLELAGYVPIAWLFISRWGIQGAAYAMLLRCGFELCVLLAAPSVAMTKRPSALLQREFVIGLAFSLGLVAAALWIALQHPIVRAGATVAILLTFVGVAWLRMLDESDRRLLTSLVGGKGGTR
jgi:O-antigen/teichoic acid export membrane protein